MQLKLSCDETTVPAGHDSMHCPFERNEPGMHAVHCSCPTVDARSKFGILHAEHLAGHAKQQKQQKSASTHRPSPIHCEQNETLTIARALLIVRNTGRAFTYAVRARAHEGKLGVDNQEEIPRNIHWKRSQTPR